MNPDLKHKGEVSLIVAGILIVAGVVTSITFFVPGLIIVVIGAAIFISRYGQKHTPRPPGE